MNIGAAPSAASQGGLGLDCYMTAPHNIIGFTALHTLLRYITSIHIDFLYRALSPVT